jgi:peptidoglycan hydrolase-like protein with peptidoglycan-binding domain
MPLDKYNLRQGSYGPSTTELQTFLNEKFDAGLDEDKFGKFGPKTEAAVNKVLETLGMEQTGVFGPDAYAAALEYLESSKEVRGYVRPAMPVEAIATDESDDSDESEMM